MRYIVFVIGLLVSLSVNGQDAVQWGSVKEIEYNTIFRTIVSGKTDYYVLRTIQTKKKKGIYLERYGIADLSFKNQAFFAFPMLSGGTNFTHERIIMCQDKLLWFVSVFDRVNRKHILYRIDIDATLANQTNPVVVDSYDISNSKSLAGFSVYDGPRKKNYLIVRKFPFDKYANEKFMFFMYDSLFQQQWQKEIELPYAGSLLEINEKLIDHTGNVHLLATLSPEKHKGDLFSRNIATNKYLLISYYPQENKLKELEINLDGKFITSVTAGVNPAGNVSVGGFYSNTNSFAVAGTFYLTVSPQSKNILSINQKPFEKEFLMQFMSEKNVNKGAELNDFYFDHFILNEDGSAILVAEEYYKQTYTYFDPNNQLYYDNNTYNFNTIIVVKVNSAGEIEWTRKINKHQVSSSGSSDYFSYALAKGQTQLYIMYNDHPTNAKKESINEDQVFALTQSKYCTPVLVRFAPDGTAVKQKLFEGGDRLVFLPPVSRSLNAETYLVCRQRKNKIQFGYLKLN